MTEHLNDLAAAQRIDDRRALYAPLREYNDIDFQPAETSEYRDTYTVCRVDTGGMHPAECVSEFQGDGTTPEPGALRFADAALIVAGYVLESISRNQVAWLACGISGLLSIVAAVHLAGMMGWLQ